MRWDRLFADLEGQAEDVALEERDALVSELRDEEWSRAAWTSVLGGAVEIDVRGAGRLAGEVGLVNETLLRLTAATTDHVIARAAVLAVHGGRRQGPPGGLVAARLGWRQVLRAARDEGETVRVVRTDETVHEGDVDVVGADFVRIGPGAGRTVTLPFAALAVVSIRR